MIPYILHVGILIAASFLFYKAVLKKLTFYVVNRWIMLSCLVVAFLLPLLPMPRQWSWMTDQAAVRRPATLVVQQAEPAVVITPGQGTVQTGETVHTPKYEPRDKRSVDPLPAHTAEAAPVSVAHPVVRPEPVPGNPSVAANSPGVFSIMARSLYYLYLLGVAILGINLLRQMISLLLHSYRSPVVRDGRYRIVSTSGMHAPCSFGHIIFIQSDAYDPETFDQILLHEKIHAGGWHTVDIILAELGIIFQWFNPFIWFFRREMENNLEFLTDRNVLKSPGIERSAYQLSLIKVAAPDVSLSITSNYNQSLLKRRIIMMNTQNSARHTAWKYLFLLPLFLLLAGLLNHPAALAQTTKDRGTASPVKAKKSQPVPATPATPEAPVITEATPAPSTGVIAPPVVSVEVAVPEVNVVPVPTPSPSPAAAPSPAAFPMPLVIPMPMFDTTAPSSHVDRSEGAWFIVSSQDKKDDKINIELRGENDDHHWNSSFSVPRSQLVNFSSVGKVDFTLTREAGTIHFTGQFDGEQGFGHYKFQADADYLAHMQQKKVVDGEDELVTFFMLDIKKGYPDMLQANGFPDIGRGHLISMAAMNIDEAYIRSVRESGYPDISEGHLITFKALHIDKAFIDDLRKAGYDHLEIGKLITFKSMKIDGDYLRRFPSSTAAGDIITYKSLHIDSAYVASLKQAGYTDLSSREIVSLRSMNVEPGFIKGFHDIGYMDIPLHTLISLKSLNVTPDYVKGFKEAGIKDIPLESLSSLKSMNVTPEYVQGFLALGYKDINPHILVSLKAMNITPEFVKAFNAIGFKDIPLNQLHSLKAMGVTPDYVSKMKEKGFVSDDLNKYIRLKNAFD